MTDIKRYRFHLSSGMHEDKNGAYVDLNDFNEIIKERDLLRKAIRDRPHTEDCAVQPWRAGLGNNCTCWKAKALEAR